MVRRPFRTRRRPSTSCVAMLKITEMRWRLVELCLEFPVETSESCVEFQIFPGINERSPSVNCPTRHFAIETLIAKWVIIDGLIHCGCWLSHSFFSLFVLLLFFHGFGHFQHIFTFWMLIIPHLLSSELTEQNRQINKSTFDRRHFGRCVAHFVRSIVSTAAQNWCLLNLNSCVQSTLPKCVAVIGSLGNILSFSLGDWTHFAPWNSRALIDGR